MPGQIEDIYAQLEIRETHYEASFSESPDPSAPFQFKLCRKQTTLGDVIVDQFWMPIPSLYGQRGRRAVNHQPIVDFYWAVCGDRDTQDDSLVRESYLLAKILPHARSNGSRKVFVDSFQSVRDARQQQVRRWTKELNERLRSCRTEEYDDLAFQRATADLIGPPLYSEEVQHRYASLTGELFGEARDALWESGTDAIDSILQSWKTILERYGRRGGHPIEKQVIDILSYECRAALHRCYSTVWSILLPALRIKYDMSDESYVFHQLWHFDRCQESIERDDAYFHLFHGQIFGLHPACGPLLQTECGTELFAEWLVAGTLQSYRRVLRAIAVAVNYYGEQYDVAKLLRKKDGVIKSFGDMVEVEEREFDQASGHRIEKDLEE
ncbi:MAG: hypothetical protein DWQ31_16480 [Planctomycetota bacterium]|nr:MAG: hypothetical protein DWQ31_16480 [Planctomycetota bacterium]REJ92847.1 MAG: hypothetical protein DWQ35_11420 [Planctomycetota bacterium]REK24628.1 MAG: hypothetical protein DWQ42_13390 [Planctomycetota bacterium]REK38354.1 MAG: hypothetical protein DWQ46_20735 [Planctomycetota bacterium]